MRLGSTIAAILLSTTLVTAAAADPTTMPTQGAPDFDLLGTPPPVSTPVFDTTVVERAKRRESMLKTHQALGLTTLGLMTAKVIVGQLNYDDLYEADGAGSGRYLLANRILGYTTAASFLATATFALGAPEGYEKHAGFDTASLHKIGVGMASAGMASQIALGYVAARRASAGNSAGVASLARWHKGVGYATWLTLAAAALVWTF